MKRPRWVSRLMPRTLFRRALKRARAWSRLHAEGRDLAHFYVLEKVPRDADLKLPQHAFRGIVPACFDKEAETLLRQVLYMNAMHKGLQAEMMVQCAGLPGRVIAAAPTGWRDELERHGFAIDKLRSIAAFVRIQLLAWVTTGATLRRYLRKFLASSQTAPAHGYAVFYGVRPYHLPDAGVLPREKRWDWISWYRRSVLCEPSIKEVWAVVHDPYSGRDLSGIRVVGHPLPDLGSRAEWLAFLGEAFARVAWGVLRWITGGWWIPLTLPHAIDLAYARRVPASDLPRQVGFNAVEKGLRPLWTYDFEQRGVRVIMYLYSMNNAYFVPKRPDGPPCAPEFRLLSWSEYAVWGEPHVKVLKKIGVQTGRFTTVGALGFTDEGGKPVALPARSIAVFDVDSQRVVDLGLDGTPRPYWDHDTCLAFVENSFAAIRKLQGTPVFKPKVFLTKPPIRPKAQHYLDLARKYDAIVMDGYVNANRVMERTLASISMPFTSTAAAAMQRGLPTAYFDPTGTLAPFEELACGIPLLLSQAELEAWLQRILHDDSELRLERVAQ